MFDKRVFFFLFFIFFEGGFAPPIPKSRAHHRIVVVREFIRGFYIIIHFSVHVPEWADGFYRARDRALSVWKREGSLRAEDLSAAAVASNLLINHNRTDAALLPIFRRRRILLSHESTGIRAQFFF